MTKLSKSEIETLAIEPLQALGFDYVYAPDIAPDSPVYDAIEKFDCDLTYDACLARVKKTTA